MCEPVVDDRVVCGAPVPYHRQKGQYRKGNGNGKLRNRKALCEQRIENEQSQRDDQSKGKN